MRRYSSAAFTMSSLFVCQTTCALLTARGIIPYATAKISNNAWFTNISEKKERKGAGADGGLRHGRQQRGRHKKKAATGLTAHCHHHFSTIIKNLTKNISETG